MGVTGWMGVMETQVHRVWLVRVDLMDLQGLLVEKETQAWVA